MYELHLKLHFVSMDLNGTCDAAGRCQDAEAPEHKQEPPSHHGLLDHKHHSVNINKTFKYKNIKGFIP